MQQTDSRFPPSLMTVRTGQSESLLLFGQEFMDTSLLLLLLSHFSRLRPCVTPLTAAHQAPPSLGLSRQECWSRLPLPSPGHISKGAQLSPGLLFGQTLVCGPFLFLFFLIHSVRMGGPYIDTKADVSGRFYDLMSTPIIKLI